MHGDRLREVPLDQVLDGQPAGASGEPLWVDVSGLADLDSIRRIGAHFGLHGLALEDVVNVHQRPKLETYDEHLFLVLRAPVAGERLQLEQVSIFLGKGFVLSFREQDSPIWAPLRERMQREDSRLRRNGSDYLVYAMLDVIADAWFPLLERCGEQLDALEDAVLDYPDRTTLSEIHAIKHDLLSMRRAVWPLRELFSSLIRGDLPQIAAGTTVYLRDCYDHVAQLIDIIETYREIASGLVDIHLSSQSAHMNEIMKVLTIIATIFIPLGTIAGIYGMNFDPAASALNMPELGWRYGYLFALGIMLATATSLLTWFWRKGWLGRRTRRVSARERQA